MEKANRKYILTQGPLAATVGHFWLMVWEQNSAAILMLNKLIEKKQVKCHQYWPEQIGPEHIMNLTDVDLTVEYLKCEQFTNFAKRTFRLTDTESNKSREVIQFHYTTWPDFCIPSSPIAFLQFLKKVRDSGTLESNVGPAVVHCSAGIGRSGTFCLVDSCLVMVSCKVYYFFPESSFYSCISLIRLIKREKIKSLWLIYCLSCDDIVWA